MQTTESYMFWAKTDTNRTRFHPLLFHMLDVAAVARRVWDSCLVNSLKSRLERSLSDNAGKLVVFLAGAHDIGKASPAFQKKLSYLQPSTLAFSQNDRDTPHGIISAHVLREVLGISEVSTLLGQIIGGHHGVFPRTLNLQLGQDTLGNKHWRCARNNVLDEFAQTVGFDPAQNLHQMKGITDPYIIPVLAGLISVVDWIGSNQDFFPCACANGEAPSETAVEYWRRAQTQADQALTTLGWLPAARFADKASFNYIFPAFTANSLQTATANLVDTQSTPYMMIIEAPMGLGKTEAALYAADLALCLGFARGMYIAMPTQATGNAMFRRVLDDYLRNRGHKGNLNLQLVHGDALLAQVAALQEGEISEFKSNSDENKASLEAQSWFTARKRPLLAPFGVGTIDQSLLSVLQTRHWFVRLFGLAGKVVIFDEVHAYDAYMSTILERLLHWLAELDCTVILLSATLPESKRKALLKEYSGCDLVGGQSYPRISLAKPHHYLDQRSETAYKCIAVAAEESRALELVFIPTDKETISSELNRRLVNGGCAAVVCNTVNRSIEVFKHLRNQLKDTEVFLFHARTLKKWRREHEEEVLKKFGKGEKQADGTFLNPNRPKRAVLIATQVIEQSLDLDFDLMLSEIAPIDLLLQRSGRLHRHHRQRPNGIETPQFIVMCDAHRSGPPPDSFGRNIEHVYDRYILLKTWLALRERDRLKVPVEVETLIEAVYGFEEKTPPDWDDQLGKAKKKMEFERSESEKAACRLLVSKPNDPAELIEQFNQQLADDEDPEIHKSIRAATREGNPSITVVTLPDGKQISSDPPIMEVRDLLDNSVKINHRGIYQALKNQEVPKQWSNNAHLRHARLLRLDEENRVRVGSYRLTVDKRLGLVIEEENTNDV